MRIVLAPSPSHHMALGEFQKEFPRAVYICGQGSEQSPPLTVKRPDLRFDGVLGNCLESGDIVLRSRLGTSNPHPTLGMISQFS